MHGLRDLFLLPLEHYRSGTGFQEGHNNINNNNSIFIFIIIVIIIIIIVVIFINMLMLLSSFIIVIIIIIIMNNIKKNMHHSGVRLGTLSFAECTLLSALELTNKFVRTVKVGDWVELGGGEGICGGDGSVRVVETWLVVECLGGW